MGLITTNIPQLDVPGHYIEFDLISGSKGLAPIDRRLLLVGVQNGGSAVAGTPYQILDEAASLAYFGKGLELDIMCRAALKAIRAHVAKYGGGSPEVWAVGVAEEAGSTAATYTLTVTGPSTAAGEVVFRVVGRTLRVAVASGATAVTVAAAIAAAINGSDDTLPVTAAVGTTGSEHIVTLTVRWKGANGNHVRAPIVDKVAAGIAVASAAAVAGAGEYDLTATLDGCSASGRIYNAVAIANNLANDITDALAWTAERAGYAAKAWASVYIADVTTAIATITGKGDSANNVWLRLIAASDWLNTPAEIASAVAGLRLCEANPVRPFNGVEVGLYPPAASSSIYTPAEEATLIAHGCTPIGLNSTGDGGRIVRLVTTKTTEASVTFKKLLDVAFPDGMAYVGWQIEAALTIAFQRASYDDDAEKNAKSVVMGVLEACEDLGICHNVADHADEIIVEPDPIDATAMLIQIPTSIIPPLNQTKTKMVLLIEAGAAA